MVRILFMPLLQIPSGHHHVADCIKEQLQNTKELTSEFQCDKLEILSHRFGRLEAVISHTYLYAIHKIPSIYSQIYKAAAVKGSHSKHYSIYKRLFINQLFKTLQEKKPNVIICTHALPSYLLNQMKESNYFTGIVINVYTDYFINDLWGTDHIDYHFVPSNEIKKVLIKQGVPESSILVSGIPAHPVFKKQKDKKKVSDSFHVLISGGNMGAGSIERLLLSLKPAGKIRYYVICGKNRTLYHRIRRLNHPFIQALPYIESKEEMNRWYDHVDAVITKPGGVTISECLWKKLPIFVYEALPEQEEFNLNYLKKQDLIFTLENWKLTTNLEDQILSKLNNDCNKIKTKLETYHNHLETDQIPHIIEKIARR